MDYLKERECFQRTLKILRVVSLDSLFYYLKKKQGETIYPASLPEPINVNKAASVPSP